MSNVSSRLIILLTCDISFRDLSGSLEIPSMPKLEMLLLDLKEPDLHKYPITDCFSELPRMRRTKGFRRELTKGSITLETNVTHM